MTSRSIVRAVTAGLLASSLTMGAASALAATVPNVAGMTYDLAVETLEEAGLTGETLRVNGTPVTVLVETNWQVSAQSPAAGTEVEDGSSVSVNLVRMSSSEARRALEAKLQREAESGAQTQLQWATDVVVLGEDLPTTGSYEGTLVTPDGEIPVTIAVEDDVVVMVAFGQATSTAEQSSDEAKSGGTSVMQSLLSAIVSSEDSGE